MSTRINLSIYNNKLKSFNNIFILGCIFTTLLISNFIYINKQRNIYQLHKEKNDLLILNKAYKIQHLKLFSFLKSFMKNKINKIGHNNSKISEKNDININKIIKDKKMNNISLKENYIFLFLILLVVFYNIYIPKILFVYLFFNLNCYCFCIRIRTGIYGGSFNPIHNGHIALAKQMLDADLMDEVWFVVSPLNPFKKEKTDLLSDELRLEMTELALKDEPNMMAQDFEFYLPKPSYTWQTLQEMSKKYPDREFILIIGADNWELFHLWFNYQEIINRYSIVIYPREGINIDVDSLPKNVKMINAELYPISSTQVRQNIKEGKSVNDLIPKSIIPKALEYYK